MKKPPQQGGLRLLRWKNLYFVGFIIELRPLHTNRSTWGHRAGDKGVGADDASFSDDSLAAQNGGTGVDRDMIFNSGVPSAAAQALTTSGGKRT